MRVAAVGDFTRFRTSERLVSYFGLNPGVRRSGGQPASHGRITKAGPRSAPPNATSPPKARPPTGSWSLPGSPAGQNERG